MQSMQIFVIAALCLAGAGAARTSSPIGKVIEMLKALEADIVKEGEESAKLKAEKDTWCKDTTVNLGFEIKTATSAVEELEAKIQKEGANINSLTEKIEELVAQLAKDDKDLKAATKIRDEEFADFEAEESELKETIDVLSRAISVLERELAKAGGAAFLQMKSAAGVVQALQALVAGSAFSSADADRLTALVQESDSGAPDAAAYESKSGGIVDVLEDLLDKAQTQLNEARAKETKAANEFALLEQGLKDAIKYAEKDKADAEKGMAKSEEEKSTAEGDLDTTTKDLAADKEMVEDVKKECMDYAADYDAEVKSRAEELAAVKKATQIIEETTGDAEAVDNAISFIQAPSFLQVRRGDSSAQAVNFVRKLARKSKSAVLAQLASSMASAVRLGAASGEDPFEKVKGLIQGLIEKLEKEGAEEAEQKAYCDKEMKEAKEKQSEKADSVESMTTKINQMTADSEKLKDSTATLQKELAELAETQKEMDKMRKAENELFVEQEKALKEGIKGVEGALKVLKDYYAKGDAAHDTKEGAASGILGMLEVCLSDFTKGLADITAAEDTAQSDYEVTTQENKVAIAEKEEAVKQQTKQAAALDKSVTEVIEDRATTQSELDAVNEYFEKLKDMCIAKPETYEMRAERRAAEIEGLKKALEILG